MRDEDFERLYEEHAQALFAFLAYRTGERTSAEDLLAETFERALRARRRFDRRKGSEKTWLYTIALNCLRDRQRRAAAERRAIERSQPAEGAEGEGDRTDERIERRDELERGMAGLSEPEREAIALRFGGELTLKEIAKLTGDPMTTVEGRVYRALRKLKDSLEPEA